MRGRLRRGFLKSYILKLLSEGEKSGYDLMQTISQETGFWKPSAGSIYPLLKSLEQANLIDFRIEDRKKVYFLTDKGVKASNEVAEAREQMRKSIAQSSQVFESIFGPESLDEVEERHDRHGPGWARIPHEIRERLAHVHCALGESEGLSAETRERITSMLDEIVALLQRDQE